MERACCACYITKPLQHELQHLTTVAKPIGVPTAKLECCRGYSRFRSVLQRLLPVQVSAAEVTPGLGTPIGLATEVTT